MDDSRDGVSAVLAALSTLTLPQDHAAALRIIERARQRGEIDDSQAKGLRQVVAALPMQVG